MEYSLRKFFHKLGSRLCLGCLILLMALLTAGSLYVGLEPYDCKILPGVHVGGMDLGGMSPETAYRTLEAASEMLLEEPALTVVLPEETVLLSPSDTKVRLNTWQAVLAAYRAGRTEEQDTSIPLLPYLELDEAYIRSVLADYAASHNTDITPSSYACIGPMPDLNIEKQGAANRPQMLQLTMGLPTARLDEEDAMGRILSAYDNALSPHQQKDFSVTGFKMDILQEPEKPNLQEIYDDLYIAPVDDSLDLETYQAVPGAFGYRFDLKKAEKRIRNTAYGQTVSIPMEFEEPEIFGDEVYFRDVLGYCETPHTKDENRNNNLRQACKAMDGLILQPGEIFSYNDTLGPRTKERGYLRAGAYSGWELVQAYGGGICQGSSTVYCAALYADLEIVHRKNHGYAVGYIDFGLDATVNWGGPDFQFRNNTHFPIKLAAEVSDGYVKVTILGTEERDYYVEMESEYSIGVSTIYAQSYKCKYDRETKELISREKEARSYYMR